MGFSWSENLHIFFTRWRTKAFESEKKKIKFYFGWMNLSESLEKKNSLEVIPVSFSVHGFVRGIKEIKIHGRFLLTVYSTQHILATDSINIWLDKQKQKFIAIAITSNSTRVTYCYACNIFINPKIISRTLVFDL